MRDCPDERTLERLCVGDGRPWEVEHLAACPDCALRMRRIERDLERIREALFADPPPHVLRQGARGPSLGPLLPALALCAAAACVALLLWLRAIPVEGQGSFDADSVVADALFPSAVENGAGANQGMVQLAALGSALRGDRPCTLEDQLDTDACDAQDVATLGGVW
jgi:hypothetical protein